MKWLNSRQSLFLFNWFLATVIGMIAGTCTSIGFHSDWLFFMINLNWVTAIGVFISATQWFILQHLTPAKWWLPASLLGFLVAATVSGLFSQAIQGVSFSNQAYRSIYNFGEGAIIGFFAGLIQWASIRNLFPKFKLWIFASILAWSFGLMIDRVQTWFFFESLHIPESMRWTIHTLLSCIPIAGFTGAVILKASDEKREV
jgi:hypothetical protein